MKSGASGQNWLVCGYHFTIKEENEGLLAVLYERAMTSECSYLMNDY